MEVKSKKLPQSQIELEFELSVEEFKPYMTKALEHLKGHVKMDGFREGKVPLKIVEERVGKENILMEAGDVAVRETYTKYIKDQKDLEVVGHPEISIVKIADGSPFVFKAVITVLPDVALPDYKEIAKTVKGQDVAVTEEEVQDSLNYLQRTRAKLTLKNEAAQLKDFVAISWQNKDIYEGKETDDQFVLGDGRFMKGFEDAIVGMKAGETKEFKATFPENSTDKRLAGTEGDFKVTLKTVHNMELPEINDEFAKQMGAFDTLVALKDSMKEGIKMEKQEGAKQQRRAEILNKIADKSKFEIPKTMVDYEKARLFEDFKHNITNHSGMKFEDYLASIKQTEDEVKATYEKEAEKRLRGFLVLRQIGKQENIEVSDEEVGLEVQKSTKNYSKEQLAKIDINELKEYTKGVIHNEKVFNILESFSNK